MSSVSSEAIELRGLIADWVSATNGTRVPLLSTAGTREILKPISRRLRGGGWQGLYSVVDDDILAALSLLGSDLFAQPEPSEHVLADAAGAFGLLSGITCEEDEYGEIAELQCRFSFLGWRHARSLRKVGESQRWLGLFEESFSRACVLRECFDYFLQTPIGDHSARLTAAFLRDAEDLFSLCALLRQTRNERPAQLVASLPFLLRWVHSQEWPPAFEDEKVYFLNQVNVSAACCYRWLGRRKLATASYDEAARLVAGTIDSETGNAEVALGRLAIRLEENHGDEVLATLPGLQLKLRSLGMVTPLISSEILLGVALKSVGRIEEANRVIEELLLTHDLRRRDWIKVFALECLADGYAMSGRVPESIQHLQSALLLLNRNVAPTTRAFLKLALGGVFAMQGRPGLALDAYREARDEYDEHGLASWSSYARLLGAESLLTLGRDREAESEILAALPTIEALGLLREGLAAVALLRESVRRRNTDRNALRELREHLKRGH